MKKIIYFSVLLSFSKFIFANNYELYGEITSKVRHNPNITLMDNLHTVPPTPTSFSEKKYFSCMYEAGVLHHLVFQNLCLQIATNCTKKLPQIFMKGIISLTSHLHNLIGMIYEQLLIKS
jgi:hypothetical protein